MTGHIIIFVGLIEEFPGQPPDECPGSGQFTYTLDRILSPTQDQQTAYDLINHCKIVVAIRKNLGF